MDAVLAKKADVSDLQRIIGAQESKVDMGSFEALIRAVEMKPDRHELSHIVPQSYRNDKQYEQAQYDTERRLIELEKQT